MTELVYIISATFIVSLISLIGVFTLALKEKVLDRILLILVSFSAGSLMGGAFLHLLPKTIQKLDSMNDKLIPVFLSMLAGFCIFFIMEQFIRWHRCRTTYHSEIKPFSYLILFSDGLHNLIDGFVIAASFVVSIPLGVITTIAVALHEIPQEIGDFGILVYGGFKRSKALLFNFLSALTSVLGGIIGFLVAGPIGEAMIFVLPFAAGNFLYIAASDLIPEIKHGTETKNSILHFTIFLAGIGIMYGVKMLMN